MKHFYEARLNTSIAVKIYKLNDDNKSLNNLI